MEPAAAAAAAAAAAGGLSPSVADPSAPRHAHLLDLQAMLADADVCLVSQQQQQALPPRQRHAHHQPAKYAPAPSPRPLLLSSSGGAGGLCGAVGAGEGGLVTPGAGVVAGRYASMPSHDPRFPSAPQ
eukprot:3452624-Rhodomonas_salina.1